MPIHNGRFPSNWELSTARATELIKLFIDRYHVEPTRLSASGFAEFHPVSENNTAEGRARNRRVDIVILNPLVGEKNLFTYVAPPRSVPASTAVASPSH